MSNQEEFDKSYEKSNRTYNNEEKSNRTYNNDRNNDRHDDKVNSFVRVQKGDNDARNNNNSSRNNNNGHNNDRNQNPRNESRDYDFGKGGKEMLSTMKKRGSFEDGEDSFYKKFLTNENGAKLRNIAYRILCGVAAGCSYATATILQTAIFDRVFPDDLLGKSMTWLTAIAVTGTFNGLQFAYRHALNEDGLMKEVGLLAYAVDMITILIGMLMLNGYKIPFIIDVGKNIAGFDLILTIVLTLMFSLTPEPLMDYSLTGRFRLFGRRGLKHEDHIV